MQRRMTTEDASVRRRVRVQGRVQGVWFRGSTRNEARRLGVAGWVRNRHDGSVEAVFEGPRVAVERMLAYVEQGPTLANVTALEVEVEPPEGLAGFEQRPDA